MAKEKSFQRILANLKPEAKPRTETLQGEEYFVVPGVMLVEGVLAGNAGPKLYKGTDMKASVPLWNHKPLVVNHPNLEGDFVSACDPDMLEDHGVGMLLNTEYRSNPNRLATECWFNKGRLLKCAKGIYNQLKKGKPVEVSTGLFGDIEPSVGTFGNKKYEGVVANYQPDHLAILPSTVGACSIADGAGLLVHAQGFDKIRTAINKLLFTKFPGDGSTARDPYSEAWVVEVWEDNFVYRLKNDYYSQAYEAGDRKGVQFVGEPEEVILEYRTLGGTLIGNSSLEIVNQSETPEEGHMAKEEKVEDKVKALIDSGKTNFTKEDEAWLGGLEEAQLDKMLPAEAEAAEEGGTTSETATSADSEVPAAEMDDSEKSLEAVLNSAHPQVREVLVNGLSALEANKTKLVKKIMANESNVFTEEQLRGHSMQQLEGIAALAGPTEEEVPSGAAQLDKILANFGGRAGGAAPSGKAPVTLSRPSTAPTAK